MLHFPLFAQLRGRACLVVGGGTVAERRVRLLLEAGAVVTVISPEVNAAIADLAARGRIAALRRAFAAEPLEPYWLVVAATDDAAINAAVARAADVAKRFCNVVDDPDNCSFIVPTIIDRDPVTIAVSSGGHSPVLARWLKGWIETMLPSRIGALGELGKRWREQVKRALPGADERRKFWQTVMNGDIAQLAFAGRAEASERALARALLQWQAGDDATRTGEAYLVGAGPGCADLLTLRGRQLLAFADVVLYDRLVNPEILKFARRDAELISVGKQPGHKSTSQSEINRLLVELVSAGKTVCRLKGGDPMVFGRAGEELEALSGAGLRFQIVPGISALEGCAAYAAIPLTLRGVSQSVLIATGHGQDSIGGLLAATHGDQTIALYMGVAHYDAVAAELMAKGLAAATPVAVVENGTTDRQRVVRTTLGQLADACRAYAVEPPSLLLIGATTAHAEAFAWFAPGRLEFYDAERQHGLANVS